MKKKWQALTWPQRVVLLLQGFLILLFLILYATLGRQQVIKYRDTLFRCQYQGDTVTYSGTLSGQKAVFTVSPGPVVEFQYGEVLYGPYTVQEDPTAIPSPDSLSDSMPSADLLTGVEIRRGSELWFRGAYYDKISYPFLVSEDGSWLANFSTAAVGKAPDPEPSAHTILSLALDPTVVPRGNWIGFWMGVFCCVLCAVSLLFADDLFRLHLSFRVRDPASAEPSEWELFSRWIGWIVFSIAALIGFLMGLNAA